MTSNTIIEKWSSLLQKVRMNWTTVVLFALLTGGYTGLVMCVPSLKDTSFQDIGISYEWWVIFAVFLVSKCEKPLEAAIKCFVFFLLSQPLVYGVEVLFGTLPIDQAWYYYRSIWLPMTFLTFPGGFVAWYSRKQSLFGAFVLALGNLIQIFMGLFYTIYATINFPHHLLSAIVSFTSVILMSFALQRTKKGRTVAICLPLLLSAVVLLIVKAKGLYLVSNVF